LNFNMPGIITLHTTQQKLSS